MRETKYKAWDKREKEWLDIKHFGFENGELWYIQAVDENERDIDPPYFPDSEDIELVQYTGMKDRNGIDIFEGDILEIPVKYGKGIGHVIFDEGCFKAFWDSSIHYPTKGKITGRYYLNSKAKIIGNVYEQPELLEVK